jgi:hypothetical protein
LPTALTAFEDYRAMLSDQVRMAAFGAAIRDVVRPGDVVVDLGAGTGVLGFMALQAGAARVHLIEQTNAIDLARAVATHNGWLDRVVFHHASSLDVSLDQPADVLVSETLGPLGIDENTLPFTLDARTRLLRPNARLIPSGIGLCLAPVSDQVLYDQRVRFWHDVGGVDMTPAADIAASKLSSVDLQPSALLGPARTVIELDLCTLQSPQVDLVTRLVCTRAGVLHGLAGWFTLALADGIGLHTGPDSPKTHWRQAYLPMTPNPHVQAGDYVDVRLQVSPQGREVDGTRVSYQWFCSQLGLSPAQARNAPCPCESGQKFKRCCGAAPR